MTLAPGWLQRDVEKAYSRLCEWSCKGSIGGRMINYDSYPNTETPREREAACYRAQERSQALAAERERCAARLDEMARQEAEIHEYAAAVALRNGADDIRALR